MSFWRSLLCVWFGHRFVRGEGRRTLANVVHHRIDGSTSSSHLPATAYVATCGRCGEKRGDLVLDRHAR